eukprot:CAMPEP_0182888768 /NCGR_PEP_ID=MMETSP0034_2-20130328/21644_1 /TAXON_ID=156128 /ORGANISM="Nephroselmis pyriformis, Strain CCMP717" /LENGTH=108 /DNA_ID=CAMNT_0025022221 /DNA_START=314 /DNA_END=637 /DNA_ORIENTATION=-
MTTASARSLLQEPGLPKRGAAPPTMLSSSPHTSRPKQGLEGGRGGHVHAATPLAANSGCAAKGGGRPGGPSARTLVTRRCPRPWARSPLNTAPTPGRALPTPAAGSAV